MLVFPQLQYGIQPEYKLPNNPKYKNWRGHSCQEPSDDAAKDQSPHKQKRGPSGRSPILWFDYPYHPKQGEGDIESHYRFQHTM